MCVFHVLWGLLNLLWCWLEVGILCHRGCRVKEGVEGCHGVWRGQEFCFLSKDGCQLLLPSAPVLWGFSCFPWITPHAKEMPTLINLKPLPYICPYFQPHHQCMHVHTHKPTSAHTHTHTHTHTQAHTHAHSHTHPRTQWHSALSVYILRSAENGCGKQEVCGKGAQLVK